MTFENLIKQIYSDRYDTVLAATDTVTNHTDSAELEWHKKMNQIKYPMDQASDNISK